jgi:hypothetical protein
MNNFKFIFHLSFIFEVRTISSVQPFSLYSGPPMCDTNSPRIQKKTNAKAILCPMIKNEEGYLAEWVGYYQMHGFDHIMFFDDNSSDKMMTEINPWIATGFVSVFKEWDIYLTDMTKFRRDSQSSEASAKVATQALLQRACKLQAIKWGYSYYLSLDVDEYLFPLLPGSTIVDTLDLLFNSTQKSIIQLSRFSFTAAPHLLEPVDLLTIEAYQFRFKKEGKFWHRNCAPKIAIRLAPPFYNVAEQGRSPYENNAAVQRYMSDCCHMHGCGVATHYTPSIEFCASFAKHQVHTSIYRGNRKWYPAFQTNHYTRSLEKHALKMASWKFNSYDLDFYLNRSMGSTHDAAVLRYSCQLREVLRTMPGAADTFVRSGKWKLNSANN